MSLTERTGSSFMAMELHVLFRGELPSKAALARTIKELEFPLSIRSTAGSLDQQSGYLPMRLDREKTGVELDIFNGRDVIDDVAEGLDIDPSFDRTASFRWGGDESEMLCALCAAAALAQLTDGLVLGEDDERPLRADEAIGMARQRLQARAKPQDKRPGTRPSDIKRYLKPLLQQRGDLVLIGRLLVVRPVRHLLRGALLDRTSDKYDFRIWWYVQALYDPTGSVGYGDYISASLCPVWQPHFEPLLINALAEDVFACVGPMTTLGDFADALADTDKYLAARVRALVLAGERDRAADYVREVEHDDPRHWENWAKEQREFLAKDVDAVCAEARAKEAETVKAMKLDAIWEPSPFPAELPVAERARSAEPLFVTTPWISRPSWLLQDVPDRPGEVRFAKDELRRKGGIVLLVPLSRDEAESRHRNGEPYVVFVREPDGVLIQLRRMGVDRKEPGYAGPLLPGAEILELHLYGPAYRINVHFMPIMPPGGMIYLHWIGVDRRDAGRTIWNCIIRPADREMDITDRRDPENLVCTDRALTNADREIIASPIPEFGDFDGLVTRTRAWLRNTGFGEIA